jgi:hypothetical protein
MYAHLASFLGEIAEKDYFFLQGCASVSCCFHLRHFGLAPLLSAHK